MCEPIEYSPQPNAYVMCNLHTQRERQKENENESVRVCVCACVKHLYECCSLCWFCFDLLCFVLFCFIYRDVCFSFVYSNENVYLPHICTICGIRVHSFHCHLEFNELIMFCCLCLLLLFLFCRLRLIILIFSMDYKNKVLFPTNQKKNRTFHTFQWTTEWKWNKCSCEFFESFSFFVIDLSQSDGKVFIWYLGILASSASYQWSVTFSKYAIASHFIALELFLKFISRSSKPFQCIEEDGIWHMFIGFFRRFT